MEILNSSYGVILFKMLKKLFINMDKYMKKMLSY